LGEGNFCSLDGLRFFDPKIMCQAVVNRVKYSTAKWQTPNAISPSSDMLIPVVFHGEIEDLKQ
jgi:hypothetical protein